MQAAMTFTWQTWKAPIKSRIYLDLSMWWGKCGKYGNNNIVIKNKCGNKNLNLWLWFKFWLVNVSALGWVLFFMNTRIKKKFIFLREKYIIVKEKWFHLVHTQFLNTKVTLIIYWMMLFCWLLILIRRNIYELSVYEGDFYLFLWK